MTPKAVVDAIEFRLGVTGAPCQLRDSIEHELLERGMDAVTAAETVDRIRGKVALEISRRHDFCRKMGEIAILHLRGSGDELVHGSSYVFLDDKDDIKKSKLNRVSARHIKDYIRGLSFSQFESFGRSVLRELGCSLARVTPHAGDQGIDFYGELSIGSLLRADPAILKLMHETRVTLIGQAKHYPNASIGPSTIRELVGALSLSRTQTFSKVDVDLFSDVHLRPFSPVVAMLFTTGDFTKGARFLALQAGIIAFSGWQLAVFLADRGVGLVGDENNGEFNPTVFNDWLANI